jgi:hypothetical protein
LQKLCGTQDCHALKNRPNLDWWLVVMWFLLLLVTLLPARIMALASSCFLPVVDVDDRPKRSASITLVWPFLNISIHSYILQCGKALRPYWAHKWVWISAPLTPLPIKMVPHFSAHLWCKLKDTLTCLPLSGNSHNEGGDQLQSRSDNQSTGYTVAKSQHANSHQQRANKKAQKLFEVPSYLLIYDLATLALWWCSNGRYWERQNTTCCQLCVHYFVSPLPVMILSLEEHVFLIEHVFCEGWYTSEVKTWFPEQFLNSAVSHRNTVWQLVSKFHETRSIADAPCSGEPTMLMD